MYLAVLARLVLGEKRCQQQTFLKEKNLISKKESIQFVDKNNNIHQIGAKDNASSHQKIQMNYAIIM